MCEKIRKINGGTSECVEVSESVVGNELKNESLKRKEINCRGRKMKKE
jgi:hypothetical protein